MRKTAMGIIKARFFNTAIRKKDVFMALLFYRGPALADPFNLDRKQSFTRLLHIS